MPAEVIRRDPSLVFRFQILLAGLPPAGFSECTGLALETEVLDYPEGGRNDMVHKLIGRTKQANLVLKRGLVDRLVWDWYADQVAGRIRVRNATVALATSDGAGTAAVWELIGAFPVRWTGPDLNAGQSAVAVETVELAHSGLRRQS